MKINKNDLMLIVAVLIFTVILFVFININKQEGATVIVEVDGKEYARCSLFEDKVIEINTDNGGKCTILIEDGNACMKEANCPDKTCVNYGNIKYKGDTVVCVPNQVIIEIESKDNTGLDAIAR